MTLEEARKSFPGLRDKVFLDSACVSLIPKQASEGIQRFLDMAMYCPAEDASLHHLQMDALRREAVEEAAKLLHAATRNIALVESTTHALNIAANSIPLSAGDNVLIADTEFLQVAIPWIKKRETGGIQVKPVANHDDGVLTARDFKRVMDSRTKVICVSSVQWSSGYRIDMQELGELCRRREIWLVVDAIQEMGALKIDLRGQYADFLFAGGHKWLNAPFGCGVMYLSDRVIEVLDPNAFGYLALEEPEDGWGEYFRTMSISPFRQYVFPKTAKRFEIAGTSNYPGAIGLGKSLKLINSLGMEHAEHQIRKLTDLLLDELGKTRAHLVSKREPGHRSGITVFRYYDRPEEDQALLAELLRQRIYLSIRYTANVGGIRVSTHFFNNEEDVLRMVHALKQSTGEVGRSISV